MFLIFFLLFFLHVGCGKFQHKLHLHIVQCLRNRFLLYRSPKLTSEKKWHLFSMLTSQWNEIMRATQFKKLVKIAQKCELMTVPFSEVRQCNGRSSVRLSQVTIPFIPISLWTWESYIIPLMFWFLNCKASKIIII